MKKIPTGRFFSKCKTCGDISKTDDLNAACGRCYTKHLGTYRDLDFFKEPPDSWGEVFVVNGLRCFCPRESGSIISYQDWSGLMSSNEDWEGGTYDVKAFDLIQIDGNNFAPVHGAEGILFVGKDGYKRIIV